MNAAEAAGDAGTMLPSTAIDEFQANGIPKAEYGWKPGSVINVGLKPSGDPVHGTAYAYGRDTACGRPELLQPASHQWDCL